MTNKQEVTNRQLHSVKKVAIVNHCPHRSIIYCLGIGCTEGHPMFFVGEPNLLTFTGSSR